MATRSANGKNANTRGPFLDAVNKVDCRQPLGIRRIFVKVSVDCGKSGVIKEAEVEWLEYAPKQCKSNPWDEWYATGEVLYEIEPEEEQLVRDWLSNEFNVGVQAYSVKGNEDAVVCLACSCPRGDTIRVMVYEEDVSKMLEIGFTKS